METILLLTFCGLTGYGLWEILTRRGAELRYPLMLSIFAGTFMLPQIYALSAKDELAGQDLLPILFLSVMSLVAGGAGYLMAFRRAGTYIPLQDTRQKDIFKPLVLLTIATVIVRVAFWSVPLDEYGRTARTGPATILHFLSVVNIFSLYLAGVAMVLSRRLIYKLLFVVNLLATIPDILINVERTEFFVIFTCVSAALFFARGITVNRLYILLAGVLMAFVHFGIKDLRSNNLFAQSFAGDSVVRHAVTFPYEGKGFLEDLFDVRSVTTIETRNAVRSIDIVEESREFDFGATLWNKLVHQYVPGQIVGHELKKALKFDVFELDYERQQVVGRIPGSTFTGFFEPFVAFWYLGPLVFMVNGYLVGRFYNVARQGSLRAQSVFVALLAVAPETVTHTGFAPLVFLPIFLIFSYPLARMTLLPQTGTWRGNIPLSNRIALARPA